MRATPTGLNTAIAGLFVVGSGCFVAGSIPAYVSAVGGVVDAVTYAVGSVFFTAASLLQLAQAQTPAMTDVTAERADRRTPIRWLSWQPHDRAWLAAITQFPGTVCFNVSTFAALAHNASVEEQQRYVWRPDLYGSTLFLISSALAITALPVLSGPRRRSLPWWICWLNMVGSIFFMCSALAGYILPSGTVLGTRVAVAGTFLGAVCFLIGAALLLPAWRSALAGATIEPPPRRT